MDEANEKHDEQSQDKASRDELSNKAVSPLTFEPGETAENANREKELISASNSSKEDEIMSSKVPSKTKVIRKGPVKKKTTTGASSRKKIQSKLKLKDEMRDSDSEGSSSDDKFLEEFESDGSDFSSSTDSDDLSKLFNNMKIPKGLPLSEKPLHSGIKNVIRPTKSNETTSRPLSPSPTPFHKYYMK